MEYPWQEGIVGLEVNKTTLNQISDFVSRIILFIFNFITSLNGCLFTELAYLFACYNCLKT